MGLTLANVLTILRMVVIPFFIMAVGYSRSGWAFALFVAAGVTDMLDGLIARVWKQQTTVGAILDPMADKLLLVSSFIVLGFQGGIAPWLVVLVVSRDLIVVLGYFILYFVHQQAMEVDPSRLGKVNTFFELFTVGFALMSLARPELSLGWVNVLFQSVTAMTTAASGLQYVYRGLLWHQKRGSVAA